MKHRDEFPQLIDLFGCQIGVEVGTAEAGFAAVLLRSGLKRLYLVDDWQNPADADKKQKAWAFAEANKDRVEIIEQRSIVAAAGMWDGSIDFVYIDADHSYPGIKADIDAWWPKTSRIFAGHDYVFWNPAWNPSWNPAMFEIPCGVVAAVEELAMKVGRTVYVTGEEPRGTSMNDRLQVASSTAIQMTPTNQGTYIPSWWIIK